MEYATIGVECSDGSSCSVKRAGAQLERVNILFNVEVAKGELDYGSQ